MDLKEIASKGNRFSGGHRLCSGCVAGPVTRMIMNASDNPAVVGCATGCLEVSSTIYPYTAWEDSFIHNAFENVAATISGVEAAYRSFKTQGKINQDYDFIAFGGDGGTYDIGFQSLSGAMERGHDMVYVCYDNGAYMNTGIQRSSATPKGANTTTSPAGEVIPGKQQYRKELTDIMAAHGIPYVAQTSPWRPQDLIKKAKKAFEVNGPAFLNILATCPRGWRSRAEQGIELTKIASETCFWPLFEVENGEWNLNYQPSEKKDIREWLKPQGRFKHLFEEGNEALVEDIQEHVDQRWESILERCGEK
ncbi:2-oxoacid:ferredoxin oxidoreductase, beta subunit [Halobacteroides halobius DSM 5150]|uniref:2-oxoacid:ferredoxin oxidoreductase, beta subunit n=1 Tax=Halobacteroides halobius (strain ATCC 35273 / DSM 5150 / MD-1) TaxID=748449 RepID=L0K6B0_HALHC|nr:thiamine pyrophosphate-dependent enzyme [Halobacteroides halobius]AGB40075.1 2-oxoacid:ferredoxin oxidoreductase, beta subunit [Halobacteroides halobius DSM 5150]